MLYKKELMGVQFKLELSGKVSLESKVANQ